MPDTSNQSPSKLWKNRSFLAWFFTLLLIGLTGFGLFFWSAGQNEKLTREVHQLEMQFSENQQHINIIGQLVEADGKVILEGDYSAALSQYEILTDQVPDSLQSALKGRINEIEGIIGNRQSDHGPDQREMQINRYRKDIDLLKQQKDSLQSALIAQSAALNEKIEELNTQLAKKQKTIQQKERIEVISFQSVNGEKIQYLGEVENGKANGGGVGIWSTGSVYRGDWKNNRRHGQGTFEWADGEVYKGTFVEGRREGQGKYYWPSGERYEGEWVNNRRNGEGTLFDMDGNVRYEGKWKDDKPVEK